VTHTQQVEASASAIRKLWDKHGIKQPMRFLGFCLSLLPLPVIQQVGQTLDRHLSDKDADQRLNAVWQQITALNETAQTVVTLEEAILEVAKTVEAHKELQDEVQDFLRNLGTHQKEFIAISEDGSFQEIVHALILAESAYFISRSGSTNSIENSSVQAQRTILHATGGSKNYVDKTIFQGLGGAVSMNGISTQGNITVQGSSVGFGPNSAIIFGGNPHLLSGECSVCATAIQVDRRQLTGYSKIQCPKCKAALAFSLPPP
jgi:hypothetical protein